MEHQAFKHINTGGLPEALEIPGLSAGAEDTKDSQDHALAEVTAQISTVVITPKSHQTPSKLQTKQGEEASNGQDEEEETLESNLLMSEVTLERQKGERSSRLRKKVDPATLYASCLGGRGISSEAGCWTMSCSSILLWFSHASHPTWAISNLSSDSKILLLLFLRRFGISHYQIRLDHFIKDFCRCGGNTALMHSFLRITLQLLHLSCPALHQPHNRCTVVGCCIFL